MFQDFQTLCPELRFCFVWAESQWLLASTTVTPHRCFLGWWAEAAQSWQVLSLSESALTNAGSFIACKALARVVCLLEPNALKIVYSLSPNLVTNFDLPVCSESNAKTFSFKTGSSDNCFKVKMQLYVNISASASLTMLSNSFTLVTSS